MAKAISVHGNYEPHGTQACGKPANVSEWDGPAVLPPRIAQRMSGGLEARGAYRHVP